MTSQKLKIIRPNQLDQKKPNPEDGEEKTRLENHWTTQKAREVMEERVIHKVVVLGDSSVGKTCIINRLVSQNFVMNYQVRHSPADHTGTDRNGLHGADHDRR